LNSQILWQVSAFPRNSTNTSL